MAVNIGLSAIWLLSPYLMNRSITLKATFWTSGTVAVLLQPVASQLCDQLKTLKMDSLGELGK
ncbi:MAG: hypothetical protein HKL96_10910 [Phycisphaerales bacterium]|nr:hypothetical protein [Phycisphaerales bacterium]